MKMERLAGQRILRYAAPDHATDRHPVTEAKAITVLAEAPAAPRRIPLLVLAFAAALLLGTAAVAAAAMGRIGLPAALLLEVAAFAGLGAMLWRRAAAAPAPGPAGARIERLLAQVVEASRGGRLIVDAEDRVIYANPAYRELTGAGDGAVPLLRDVLSGDALEKAERIERAARAGSSARDELPLVGLGGNVRWLNVSGRGMAGAPGLILWFIEDATVPHEMQEVVRAEQEKLTDFIDNAPVGFYSADRDNRIQFVNGTLARWLGRSPEDLTDGSLRLADVIEFEQPAGSGLNQGEAKLRGRDGSTLPVRVTQSVRSADGGELRTRSVVHDLTQELTWRRALEQAETHFRQFFDFAPVGIVVLDQQDQVLETNAAFRTMIGPLLAGGAGRNLLDLVKKEDRAEVAERLAAAHRGSGSGMPIEVRLDREPERVAHLYVSRLHSDATKSSDLLLHLIDTTDQKNLELQFAQSQKMQAVGQLAGGIAHDFNNLLTAMIGFCDLLLLRHQAGDQSFADIMQIKQNANRAANLVRQLLAFSRQQTLRPKVLVITDVLAELSNLLRRLIGETIELKMVHGRDLGLVKVDHGQLEQVIINLAVNARDAMPDGGTLSIRTANVTAEESTQLGHELMPAGEYVLIEVGDSGKGIPKEILGKIFEPFFTTKPVGAGTGLGLSTVYGIVKQTGGFVFPFSEAGKGASFKIYLPRYRAANGEEEAGEAAERRETKDLTGKGTVLLVEDEDAVRIFAARALRNKGYTVLEANSGEAALVQVNGHQGKIDVLISDVVMPNMDGPTLAKKVKGSRPEMKIIFISGYAEDAFRRNLDRDTDFNFLPKPFSLKQLAGKVKEVMNDAKAG